MIPRSRFLTLLLSGALTGALACTALLLPAPALAVSDDPVLRRMDNVLEENTRLREEAWKSRKNHDRDSARQADEALNASEERLERTRTEALAHVAGVSPAQVEGLRKDGRSWGQAAGELGVHPGFLGVGKAPLYQSLPPRKAKVAEATPEGRNEKGGKGGKGLRGKKKAGTREPAPKGKPDKAKAKESATQKAKAPAKGKALAEAQPKAKPKKAARNGKETSPKR